VLAAVPHCGTGRLFYGLVLKRGIDVVVACLALLGLLPLLLLVALVIRLDSRGPAIFRQQRVGRGGRLFVLYKFRTMQDNAAGNVAWTLDDNGRLRHKHRQDPRVTRVGRWLRRTSMDELPQLINIVKGDMSLIGPRPELPEIVARYEPWQHDRHLVRPGLTGWWQVSGRSDLPMHENTELDLFYVRRLSFQLDWRIALKTVRVVFKGLGAF
jgi:lipopolysaccharide/colanic/teichoic acid biosynthesis glycosyltransferase